MIISKYVRIGERGQIVIPKEIREKEKLVPNQMVKIVYLGGEIAIRTSTQGGSPEDNILKILQRVKLTEEDWKELHRDREER
ncbi:AbrB/MazE/SpoVT family DNA-binding domain-containing protein [Candidatus Woesearchaeota archaeon]|nr:AbrB/MazE/SpoVT family DNA-binding domain-containing protein [Candidatus Woesearchaeota archaeon]